MKTITPTMIWSASELPTIHEVGESIRFLIASATVKSSDAYAD